jgi:N-acyl-D-aspartate/D-glutamate deacylase
MIADLNVFDPDTVAGRAPKVETDLPTGAPRVTQRARGYLATVVAGKQTLAAGEHTGMLPGQLIRGRLAPGAHRR